MTYRDFTLRIAPEGAGFRAQVLESPLGERAECAFELPLAPGELTGLAGALGRAVRAVGATASRHLCPEGSGGTLVPDLYEVGRRLSDAVFQGAVRERFRESALAHPHLRVRLRFDLAHTGAARVHRIPWELLLSPATARPLALSRRTPVVRYLEAACAADLPPAPDTLEILLVAAQPPGTERLDLDGEEGALRSALSGRTIRVRRAPRPSLAGIAEALCGSATHVLHVMGHADLDPETGEGVLLLEDNHGRLARVTARELLTMVDDRIQPLRLVFLNACRTAEASERAPLAGFAPVLVEAGVPAVVAMQCPVTDRGATLFASTVYAALASGGPIDRAVTEGRRALWGEMRGPSDLPEWATPALFLRVPDGRLFAPREARAGEAAVAEPEVEEAEAAPATAGGTRAGRRWLAGVVIAAMLVAGVAGVAAWRGLGGSPDVTGEARDTTGTVPEKVPEKVPAGFQNADGGGPDEAPADFLGRPSGPTGDGGDSRQGGRTSSPDRELADGTSAELPEVAATVTVEFPEVDGESFVTVSVLPEGGSVQRQPAFGPDTLVFQAGDDSLAVHVLHIDWSAATVLLRVTRTPTR